MKGRERGSGREGHSFFDGLSLWINYVGIIPGNSNRKTCEENTITWGKLEAKPEKAKLDKAGEESEKIEK